MARDDQSAKDGFQDGPFFSHKPDPATAKRLQMKSAADVSQQLVGERTVSKNEGRTTNQHSSQDLLTDPF